MAVWSEGCYLNNFVQGVLDTFPQEELKGSTIIVSGDGRSEKSTNNPNSGGRQKRGYFVFFLEDFVF